MSTHTDNVHIHTIKTHRYKEIHITLNILGISLRVRGFEIISRSYFNMTFKLKYSPVTKKHINYFGC